MEKGRAKITTRRPMGTDVGAAEWSDFTIENGVVTLVDSQGKALPRKSAGKSQTWSRKLRDGEDAERAARDLLWAKFRASRSGSDFNRPINYPPTGVV
jgi:hypothetical protein